ncbi:MAG: FAD:protein FMN transferase [Ghiorsea sp.]
MQTRFVVALLLCFAGIAGVLIYDGNKSPAYQDIKETRFLLGTIVTFNLVYAGEESVAQYAIEQAIKVMQDIEHTFTTHGEVNNSVQRFNQALPSQRVTLDTQVSALLQQSLHIHQQTSGAFDPALGRLNQLWGFSGQHSDQFPPSVEKIDLYLHISGAKHIIFHGDKLWSKDKAGVALDFGAIAKGLAVDAAMDKLQALGIKHAIINAGGDLRIVGKHGNRPWKIAVRHPRSAEPLGWFEVDQDMSIVTSGDYERFYMYEGKRYHHILNPKTGVPATASMSVTVIAKQAAQADALSTAMFVLGAAQGLPIIERMVNVEAIWVDKNAEIMMSSGMKGIFHTFDTGEHE